MEKILIVGCNNVMDDICIACSRCMVGFNRRNGEFSCYDKDAELLGILGCGGCPGTGIVTRLAQLASWNFQNKEQPTKLHIAPCIVDHCPEKEILIQKINAKTGIKVIEGTHLYKPDNLFA